MKNTATLKMFIMIGIYCIFANLAHPITPTLIINLELPDYMFGVAFASMSLTNFLFSPLWGQLIEKFGPIKVSMIGFIGYGIGQGIFGLANTSLEIIFGRLFSGVFISAVMVSQLIYLMKNSEENMVGTNLTISATIYAIVGPVGYLLGGYLGDYSITLTFIVQVIGLCSMSFLYFIFMKDTYNNKNVKITINDINPFKAFISSKEILNKASILFLFIVFFTSFGVVCHDQVFNFFINDQFLVDPSYNGIVKALVALLALAVNSTICIYLVKNTNIKISMLIIYILISLSLFVVLFINDLLLFTIQNLIIYGLIALYTPVIQAVLSQIKSKSDGVLVGLFNSIKALGSVIGSLSAGFIYGLNSLFPFIVALLVFLVASLMSIIFIKDIN